MCTIHKIGASYWRGATQEGGQILLSIRSLSESKIMPDFGKSFPRYIKPDQANIKIKMKKENIIISKIKAKIAKT